MMRTHPCGCALDWGYNDHQCPRGVALATQVDTARRAYHADPYASERLYQVWQAATQLFAAHFAEAPPVETRA